MKISLISVFPELYRSFLQTSLIKRAAERGLVEFDLVDFFSTVAPKERIDAPTFGHGAGMLIKPEVMERAIEVQDQKYGRAFKIFFSPQGKKIDQRLLSTIALKAQEADHLMLVASRYEGTDARVEEHYADLVVSVGDFVVMGGDLPAMLLLEGALRLIPGVVGSQESVVDESFSGAFIEHPEYTAPVTWKGISVPDVVRSGNHAEILRWRQKKSAERTIKKHFNWFRRHCESIADRQIGAQYIPPHYAILMHDEVLLPNGIIGKTSVTSFDLHDVSRSCKTFGIKNYFIATPLIDQKKIAQTLLDFWQTGVGIDYNKKRHEAVSIVCLVDSLAQAIEKIEQQEGKKPLLIGTSARCITGVTPITYQDQELVWSFDRPILFVFGTGKGLSSQVLERCDFMLGPILGFSGFNHLSVRAAVSIILDRWLGINLASPLS